MKLDVGSNDLTLSSKIQVKPISEGFGWGRLETKFHFCGCHDVRLDSRGPPPR